MRAWTGAAAALLLAVPLPAPGASDLGLPAGFAAEPYALKLLFVHE